MSTNNNRWCRALACAAVAIVAVNLAGLRSARADEGMWLINDLPAELLEERYGWTPDAEMVERLQRAALKFGWGGSASFVSGDGLVMTNHHVARGQIVRLSRAGRNLLEDGFLAASPEEELRCPDAVVMSLREIVDVTDEVRGAAAEADDPAEGDRLRREAIARIEARAQEESGLFSRVVTLFGGGMYHLYKYDRWTDVRLVWAPSRDVAAFGGDVDNFEFPRWCLDVTLLRVYDDAGEPVRPRHFLRFTTDGVRDGEPVFVVGHPGRTQRLFTVDHLRFLRDVAYPAWMRHIRTREVELLVFASEGEEQARQAVRELAGVQNGRKGLGGKLRALQDPSIFGMKVEEERRLREAAGSDGVAAGAFAAVERSVDAARLLWERHYLLESRPFNRSDLYRIARDIVRLVDERSKSDEKRLPRYRDANMDELERSLYSPAPIERMLEENRIESALAYMAEVFGADDPVVQTALAGEAPRERAREIVAGTSLFDVEARRALVEGGQAEVWNTDDPMIQLAAALDTAARRIRERYENEVEAVQTEAYQALAQVRFEHAGELGVDGALYPDATGTLRLATGRIKGFELEGEWADPFTDFAGMYDRWEARGPDEPFDLPASWIRALAQGTLGGRVEFNFTSTNDIIGGNSGSPVVNRDGEVVGLIFDGNRYSFVWDALYTGARGRAVSVDVRGIVESLRTMYDAEHLVEELMTGRLPAGG